MMTHVFVHSFFVFSLEGIAFKERETFDGWRSREGRGSGGVGAAGDSDGMVDCGG